MDNQNETFTYTYSAKEQAEIQAIRKKYLPKEEDKMEQLRRLDRIPVQKAQAWSIALGLIGALILGTGMSLCMTEFGIALGAVAMPVGIAIGLVGMVLVGLAYPVFNMVLRKERDKVAPEILRLTADLMK